MIRTNDQWKAIAVPHCADNYSHKHTVGKLLEDAVIDLQELAQQRDYIQSALNAERASLLAENQKRQDVERQLAEAIASRQAAQRELMQVIEETQRRAGVLIKDAFRRGVDSERDACSKLCEQMSDDIASPLYSAAANDCAIAIRSRSRE